MHLAPTPFPTPLYALPFDLEDHHAVREWAAAMKPVVKRAVCAVDHEALPEAWEIYSLRSGENVHFILTRDMRGTFVVEDLQTWRRGPPPFAHVQQALQWIAATLCDHDR